MITKSFLALACSATLASATPTETPASTPPTEAQNTPSQNTPSAETLNTTVTVTSSETTSQKVVDQATVTPVSTTSDKSSFSPSQLEELKSLIKEEISKNPETIMKTVQAYGEEQQKIALKQETAKMSKFTDELTDDKTAIISGDPKGNIKLVVFGDPNCGHCRHFENELNAIKGEFSNVKIYTRPWAIRGKESVDVINGLVALYAKDPAKFEAVSKVISSSQEGIDKAKFLKMVKDTTFDSKKLDDKTVVENTKKIVDANKDLAEKKLGLTGTPSIFLIDKDGLQIVMPGDKESIKKLLSEAKA